MMRFTCRGCLDLVFVLCFARLGCAWIQHLYCVLHTLRLCDVMRFTYRERQDSTFVSRSAKLEALPGDAIHLQGVSRLNICIAFCEV